MGNNEKGSKILLSAGGGGKLGGIFVLFISPPFFFTFGFCFMKKAVFLLPTLRFSSNY